MNCMRRSAPVLGRSDSRQRQGFALSSRRPTPHRAAPGDGRTPGRAVSAFSLVELIIVMTLLSVIVLGLLSVFNQTQRAFKAGIAQVDVMESGRATMDLITREVEQMGFLGESLATNTVRLLNFQSYTPQGYKELKQDLPGTNLQRTNILQEVFFIQRVNQELIGTGYFVEDFDFDGVGTLYRYTTNIAARDFSVFRPLINDRNPAQTRRVADGVIHFKVTPLGLGGWALEPGFTEGFFTNSSKVNVYYDSTPSGVRTEFINGAIPTGLEIELAVVEEEVLKQLEALPPNAQIRRNYLAEQGGKTHLFKQQVTIRNADERLYR